MPDEIDAILILSRDGMDSVRAQNSAAWRIDPARAKAAQFLILAHNTPDEERTHRKAFLVAKGIGLVPRVEEGEPEGRWAVTFDSYAELDVEETEKEAWTKGNRFPVQYVNAEERLGFNPDRLAFKKVGKKELEWSYSERVKRESDSVGSSRGLTINEAKQGLAVHLGCKPSDIEITIKT